MKPAREAGVDETEGVLEGAIRKMVPAKKSKTFTASTEPEARKKLASWKRAHPNANIREEKLVNGKGLGATESEGTALVSIFILYDD